jgi:hypothetical protein
MTFTHFFICFDLGEDPAVLTDAAGFLFALFCKRKAASDTINKKTGHPQWQARHIR